MQIVDNELLLSVINESAAIRLDQPMQVTLNYFADMLVRLSGCSSVALYVREADGGPFERRSTSSRSVASASMYQDRLSADTLNQPPSDGYSISPLMSSWQGVVGLIVCADSSQSPSFATAVAAVSPLCAQAIANSRLYEHESSRAMELEELGSTRRDFVSVVSHELRTPLTAIQGFTETLLVYWERLPDEQRLDMLRKSQSAAYRLNRLIQDLVLISRVDFDTLTLTSQRTNLAALIDQAASEITTKYAGQVVQKDVDPALTVYGDPHRIAQVLVNLLDNAAKYSPEGQPIHIEGGSDTTLATITVSDGGKGVPAASTRLLFTRFGKLGSTIRSGHVGIGLGLYISKYLVEAMGGSIWLKSTGPQGSSFSFTLPKAAPDRVTADRVQGKIEAHHLEGNAPNVALDRQD